MWSIFFEYGDKPEFKNKLNEITKVKEEIAMANEILNTISKDEHEIARFRARRKFELDHYNDIINSEKIGLERGMQKGMQKGIQKGMQKGMQKGKTETAIRLLKMNSPIDFIAEATGLLREEIEKLTLN